ncbi:60S ribosomal protein L10a-2 [Capsella rubella]|uniref:60S ribosomal protein L10a-2 n=1 Tax=Capsella rubella TaxID=81985 RepID=UPI000CD552A0|nr:60S ribosomal protein L10a-2 [Capsella rubella]
MSKLNSEAIREAIACIRRTCEERKLNVRKLQSEAIEEAITVIRRKSNEEKKHNFKETVVKLQSEALREATTTIKDKSEEKKCNFVETMECQSGMKNCEPTKEKCFNGSVKLLNIPVKK